MNVDKPITTNDEVNGKTHYYRLSKITEIQPEITREREKIAILCGKYQRYVKLIGAIYYGVIAAASLLTMVRVGVLAAIIAVPIAAPMLGVASVVGAFCLIGGQINKKLALRREKHDKIKSLAEAKLKSINDYVSKALEDDYISEQKFSLVLSELDKFNDTKKEERSRTKASIDDETKAVKRKK